MTAWSICSSPRAMSPRCRISPRRTPTTCCCKRPTANSRKSARRQASPTSPSRAARLSSDFNLDGLLDLVVVNRWENAQTLAQHQHRTPAAGSRSSCSSRRPTATRSAPGSRSTAAIHGRCAAKSPSAAATPAASYGWWHFGLGDSAAGRGARGLAGRHRRRMAKRQQQQFLHSGAGQSGAGLGGEVIRSITNF